ncbi:MAG: exopolysaccharide biosynthesis polyprenyl glycosylphosphotransferase [Lachnospiraceae bacterium]|nr:exopolysaccharide biosynthesis polyprenyl glycosylphosphotransferase [Lachnospiraceae bacterium]MCR5739781.1 exopolysaccharide biosynthesis polyprenyl glycosylphosphotransferase [Lachnospiraceae bacterium]
MILNEEQYKKAQFRESTKRLINLLFILVCIGLEIGIFAYHWIFHFQYSVVEPLRHFWFKGHLLEITIYGVILLMFSSMYGGIRLGYLKNSEIVFSQMFATLLSEILIYGELSLMAFELFRLHYFIYMIVEQLVVVAVYIPIANKIYRHIFPPRKLLLIYGSRNPDELKSKFETRRDKYVITDTICSDEGYDAIEKRIADDLGDGRCNAVVIGDISVTDRKPIIKYCYANSIRFYMLPKINDVILLGAEELHVFDSPILLNREYSLTVEERVVKRFIDILFSLILIILSSPFMLLTAIAVKACDGGPVLYKQIRCTRGARKFTIYKFRSMRIDAEKDGVARLASKGDSRITPVGKFIRKVRLDELPQLFNILKGDMSFIGPRPERPEIIEQYLEIMPEFAYRMKVKAGLAGFAQVYGKYNTTPYDKLKLDLIYIEKYSIMLDLKLMLLTLKVLFWPDSTEGVEKDQITALKNGQDTSHKQEDE